MVYLTKLSRKKDGGAIMGCKQLYFEKQNYDCSINTNRA